MIRRLKTVLLAIAAAVIASIALAHSDGIYNPSANNVGNFEGIDSNKASSIAPSFQGPGDIVASAVVWGSCSRAYNASYANGTNPLCDLKDVSTATVAICTLRVKTNGFVDLTGTYCTGSTTPAAACAAAAGGSCVVTQIYDQTGNANNFTTSAGNPPGLTFNVLNSLPSLTCSQANTTLSGTAAVTINQPMSFSGVWERTANPTNPSIIIGASNASIGYPNGVANQVDLVPAAGISAPATDSAFHAVQGVLNGASSLITVDNGTPGTGSNASAIPATALRFCRGSTSLDGFVMEFGIWPSAFSPTQYGNMNANQHGANGYNF